MAEWTQAYQDSLPSSAFAFVDPKTGERHLPYKNKAGNLDALHVRDALARLDETDISESAKASARKKLVAAAKQLGIEVGGEGDEDDDSGGKRAVGSGVMRMRMRMSGSADAETITRLTLPCEIRVVDAGKREIELCATSEAVDTFGTSFGYEASKAAFERWIGNVREMHALKAIGRSVAVRCDDGARRIYVRLRVSKGAQDTWEKVLDGTLRGASIGASNVVWQRVRSAEGRDIPVASSYDLMELSLVDNPSNPDALGVTFVRAAAPTEVIAQDHAATVDTEQAGEGARAVPVLTPPAIVEPAGGSSLSVLDMAAQIAADALARGRAAVQAGASGAGTSSAAADPTDKQRRLAALGAPGYLRAAGTGTTNGEVGSPSATPDSLGGTAPGEHTPGYDVGAGYDVDGDHEDASDYVTIQSGPTAGAVASPSPEGSVAHMVHSHHHTGRYDDPSDHREQSAHQHLDGTSHVHEHVMDHRHGGHEGVPAGHTHPHGHVPDHEHYYRVADGAPLDARLVSAEQVRTFAFVPESAFRAVGGIAGRALSAGQMRVAMSAVLLGMPLESRSLGPYSRDANGPADAGTPAGAANFPTTDLKPDADTGAGNEGKAALSGVDISSELRRIGSLLLTLGGVRPMDRDGQPVEALDLNGTAAGSDPGLIGDDGRKSGQLDVTPPADGWTGRAAVAEVTRQVAEIERRLAPLLETKLGGIEQRLAKIEAQPTTGGPVLRAADKSTALTGGSAAARPEVGPVDHLRALESLAGKLSDPQAQIAVATEMIRLQQEAAGMVPAMQIMPRAGAGWGVREVANAR